MISNLFNIILFILHNILVIFPWHLHTGKSLDIWAVFKSRMSSLYTGWLRTGLSSWIMSPQYIQRILTAELIINRPLSMIFPCFDNSTAIRSAIRFLAGRLVNDIWHEWVKNSKSEFHLTRGFELDWPGIVPFMTWQERTWTEHDMKWW